MMTETTTPSEKILNHVVAVDDETLVLYIQPSPSRMFNFKNFNSYNMNNCTNIRTPCASLAEALQFAQRNTSFTKVLLKLMNDSDGNVTYGSEQCLIDVNGYFRQVTITSLNLQQIITLDCNYQKLNKHLGAANLVIFGIKLFRMDLWLMYPTIVNLDVTGVELNHVRILDEDVTTITPLLKTITISLSSIKNSTISVQNKRWIEIKSCDVSNSSMSSKISSKISLTYCKIDNFQFTVDDRILALRQLNIDFSISYCRIINSTFIIYEFNSTIFEDVQFYGTNIIQHLFSYETKYSRVTARDKADFKFHGVTFISLGKCTFTDLEALDNSNKYIISVETTSGLLLDAVTSYNNRAPLFYIREAQGIRAYDLNFTNNVGPCMTVKSNLYEPVPGLTSSFQIYSSTFENNFCTTEECKGGALQVVFYLLHIQSSVLRNNSAFNGGAVHVETGLLSLFSVEFIQNIARSKGGAVYIGSGTFNSAPLSIAFNCLSNIAYYSGGCIYFHSPIQSPINWKDVIFNQNEGMSYGNDLAESLHSIRFDVSIQYASGNSSIFRNNQVPELYLYPGQLVSSIEITVWNNVSERVKFLENPISYQLDESKNALLNYDKNPNNSLALSSLTVAIFTPNVRQVFPSIYLDTNTRIDTIVHIEPCPQGKSLVKQDVLDGAWICVDEPYIPYETIIAVASITSILLFSLFLLALYALFRLIRNIISKLKRLEKKEKAEKLMESKLLEKRVVLMEGHDHHESALSNSLGEKSPLLVNHHDGDKQDSSQSNNGSSSKKSVSSHTSHHAREYSQWIISIDEIEIMKRIADGANGTVYLASWNGTKVALKTLKHSDEPLDASSEDEEFEREASLLGSISTSEYCTIFWSYSCRKQKVYGCGMTLFQKIDILFGVAKGMNYLHTLKPKGIIHRDLKPGNILIDNHFTAKICDFGLSKALTDSNSATTNIGTLSYMANEMIEGNSNYNHKVDVYSFAIIMWELFFEETPYLNSACEKLYKFIEQGDDVSRFNVIVKVLKGERPVIPFRNHEEMREWISVYLIDQTNTLQTSLDILCDVTQEFVSIMTSCWNANYSERPEFSEVCLRLSKLLEYSK
ncbi:hypothetical protein C9374_010408 [Naegleria lovaniensis]|uniref:Protein kinase domain-containing protein n=1 Tax=Naegleria lovaniensis TaxID=51637 RepID=A0AA88GE24_NAELO|nr:uncharacterized protein C9374_010408 [Naegleria lovaniensis]KAG2374831.1 hypothetical protein C9374_010408 [Naegleria lovaniensis]